MLDNVIACVMKREEKKVKFTTDLLTNKILIPPPEKKKKRWNLCSWRTIKAIEPDRPGKSSSLDTSFKGISENTK